MNDTPRHMTNEERHEANIEGLHTVDGVLYAGQHKVLKAWESFTGWYWFGVEKSEERKVGTESGGSIINGNEVDDVIWFGYVQGFECEWGYFSEAEIKSMGNLTWAIKPQDLPYAGRRS